MRELSIYVHIPFCDHKCIYCDFYSLVSYENTENFFISLEKEIKYYANIYGKNYKVGTIFFGGGTPSFVDSKYLKEVIKIINNNFSLSSNPEITIETNPGTVDKNKLKSFLAIGINRISIGIQSFNEDELKFLTRIHDKETAIETVKKANSVGFENISIDLIFNLPNQSKKLWMSNLQTAVDLPISHISTYSLILERGTILNKMVIDGKVKMQDVEIDADLYESTIKFFSERNWIQYEVSNFAKPGYECKHNLTYWQHKEYIGFGTAAHSFVNGKRWWNYSSLKMYIEAVNKNGHAVRNEEILSRAELQEEYIMLNLRGQGLSLIELNEIYGSNWYDNNKNALYQLEKECLITAKDNFIKFTSRGYALCDEILANFL